jgi:hypothetical protein
MQHQWTHVKYNGVIIAWSCQQCKESIGSHHQEFREDVPPSEWREGSVLVAKECDHKSKVD